MTAELFLTLENLVNQDGVSRDESSKTEGAAKVLLLLTMVLVNGMHEVCSFSCYPVVHKIDREFSLMPNTLHR